MTPELRKALFECTSKDHPNKALHGVLFCDDYIIASDSTLLVKVKKEFDFENYIELEDGSTIGWDYPNTKHGIFVPGEPYGIEHLKELKRAAALVPKSEDKAGFHIALDLKGKMVYPPVLLKALAVFEALEEDKLMLFVCDDRVHVKGLLAEAIVMTLGIKGNPNARCKEAYTVAQILAMEDLL